MVKDDCTPLRLGRAEKLARVYYALRNAHIQIYQDDEDKFVTPKFGATSRVSIGIQGMTFDEMARQAGIV